MKSGITQRWLRGSLAVTVLVVAVAEALFLAIGIAVGAAGVLTILGGVA